MDRGLQSFREPLDVRGHLVDVAFGAAGKRTVRVPLTAAGRRALKGRRRARIVVRLAGRDVRGNRTTRKLSLIHI